MLSDTSEHQKELIWEQQLSSQIQILQSWSTEEDKQQKFKEYLHHFFSVQTLTPSLSYIVRLVALDMFLVREGREKGFSVESQQLFT